jgi:hypothetical protein
MKNKILTYSEAIERVLLDNGYVAPLRKIYKEIQKYRPLTGQTPFYTIQERVQRDPRFTRVGLGVYALTEFLEKLPVKEKPRNEQEEKEQTHSSIQGMLLEIGNCKEYNTYAPNKNASFKNKRLVQLMTLMEVPNFTYSSIVKAVKSIDVLWFNERGFPKYAFEIEYTTQFRNSLIKFSELADFHMLFYFVSGTKRENKYYQETSKAIFKDIVKRCKFITYNQVMKMYDASVDIRKASLDFF